MGRLLVEPIIGAAVDRLPRPVDSSAIDPKHQISDGVGVRISATPADRFTVRGAHPDHALLSPQLTDPKSVAHVGRPVATVRIELAPCTGLNCDGVGHVVCFVPCILQGQRRIRSPAVYSTSAVTLRTGWIGSHRKASRRMAIIALSMVGLLAVRLSALFMQPSYRPKASPQPLKGQFPHCHTLVAVSGVMWEGGGGHVNLMRATMAATPAGPNHIQRMIPSRR